MPHKRCRVEVTRLVVTALRKWGACGWHQWSEGLRTISPLLVPSRSPRTSALGDFLLKAAMSMTPTELAPNAGAHLLPEAGATQERTLEAVRCSALLGPAPALACGRWIV